MSHAKERCAACGRAEAKPGRLLCGTCALNARELEARRLGLSLPKMPVAIVSIGLALACGPVKVPCDAHDHKSQAELATKALECDAQIDACDTAACVDEVVAACKAQAAEVCREK